MEIEKLKVYLKHYIEKVLTPRINKSENQNVTLMLHDVLKGTFKPPMIHVFVDVEPQDTTRSSLKQTETEIENFFQSLSIYNPIKIHWNKRPFIRKGKTLDKNI